MNHVLQIPSQVRKDWTAGSWVSGPCHLPQVYNSAVYRVTERVTSESYKI